MYLGIFLVPWILLFGLSGVLFNHPNVGEAVRGAPVHAAQLTELTGFRAWEPNSVARRIVDSLNGSSGAGYSLSEQVVPHFQGAALLTAGSPTGKHTALVDVERGRAFVLTRQARPNAEQVPFKSVLELEEISTQRLEEQMSPLLAALQLPATSALVVNRAVSPQLRFAIRDAEGILYHATYDVGSSQLGGRVASSWSPVGFSQLLRALHTTHHFTPYLSFRWGWALFQDLLGLAMAFWAISGAIMWWQLKATRVAGLVSVGLAFGLAVWIGWGTASDVMFGEVTQELGPG